VSPWDRHAPAWPREPGSSPALPEKDAYHTLAQHVLRNCTRQHVTMHSKGLVVSSCSDWCPEPAPELDLDTCRQRPVASFLREVKHARQPLCYDGRLGPGAATCAQRLSRASCQEQCPSVAVSPLLTFTRAVELWDTMPGIDQRRAELSGRRLGLLWHTQGHAGSLAGGAPWHCAGDPRQRACCARATSAQGVRSPSSWHTASPANV
jgi:hypothetical protein